MLQFVTKNMRGLKHMRIDKKQYQRQKKYNAKAYEQIKIQSRREKRLNELIKYAAQKRNISASAYIVMAIEQQLSYDNITIDSLADLEQSNEIISEDNESD